ncbi:S8 family serine peptidase [Agaribacterium sp. ZY112]|uniref:S8 family serine peptidase n=1 Tax=Agaribacterium sp. ZY112 TaxID=3233574 RepID=UPI003525811A
MPAHSLMSFIPTHSKKLVLALALSTLFSACDSGSSGSLVDDKQAPSSQQDDSTQTELENVLEKLPIVFSDAPTQGEPLTIELINDEDLGNLEWQINNQPSASALVLSPSDDNSAISLTATEPGSYEITLSSPINDSERVVSFYISPILAFDETKIEGNNGDTPLDELIGIISNQSWVYSSSLDESDLTDIVNNYAAFSVIGYDPSEGLLIEYDETSKNTLEALESLKLDKGVSSLNQRTYEGKDANIAFFTPDDGSSFTDGGNNWHLESANLVEAWDINQGSDELVIGISDSGFYTSHEDLNGRFAQVLTSSTGEHGTAVASAIGAITDNQLGISGINAVSQMHVAPNNKQGQLSLLSSSKLKVLNSSWGSMGNDSGSPDKAMAHTRKHRKTAAQTPDVLHVWAAGNDGADANTQNGALHLNHLGYLDKAANIMVVAALGSDGNLVHYSDFGETVDIAAPTEFMSAKSVNDSGVASYFEAGSYGSADSGAFGGTSAATAVVSGVASLIYSIHPSFSGDDVKTILLETADTYVTSRHMSADNNDIETLEHSIPVLNAKKALERAQAIVDGQVIVRESFNKPFKAQAQVSFTSLIPEFSALTVQWELYSSTDNGENWTLANSGTSIGPTISIPIETGANLHRLTGSVNLRSSNDSGITTDFEHEFSHSSITITAANTISLAALNDAELSLEKINTKPLTTTGFTNSNGHVTLYLAAGTYNLYGSLSGYQSGAMLLNIGEQQNLSTTLNLSPQNAGGVGSISGHVFDIDGNAIEGASVRISGGEQTNGFFASAVTNTYGHYQISNISKTDSSGAEIESFSLQALAFPFGLQSKEDIIVLSGKERIEDFHLTDNNLIETIVFEDDFEEGRGDWSATGLWNQINLNNSTIANRLVDNGHTSLAPDEEGPEALLPSAYSGNFAWWYGASNTGTFVGEQTESDGPLSGGTSTESNSGLLTHSGLSINTNINTMLRFRTWWEIESVNPNASGFDIMELQVSTDAGVTWDTIKKLNPFVDPKDTNRNAKPFSSGGYNRKPVWAFEIFDLSDYAGQHIQLRFSFETKDSLYNGFRGWLIDNLEIIEWSTPEREESSALNPNKTPISNHYKAISYPAQKKPSR